LGIPLISTPIDVPGGGGKLRAVSDTVVPGLRYASGAQELWALVIAALGGWEEQINEVSAAAGLSPVSAWTLVQLDTEHPISQKELATRLKCNPSTVVDPTDRLEEAGLVVRKPKPADRRINVLFVTAKGKKLRDELIESLFEPPEAFRRLPAKEVARFRDVMLDAVRAPASHTQRRGRRKPPARK
jgi:DNA-binding MarR family transcriptional regulator